MNQNQQPLVSVLMTSYNREKYIRFAIESVLNSTYKNFELIISDDGSKDQTVEIALEYAAKDQRVKVCINETNLGDYGNRSKAASLASGKYLKYVDSDDYIYPSGLEHLVGFMEQYPEAALGICSLNQDRKQPFPIQLTSKEAFEYHYMGAGLFHKAPLSTIIRKDKYDEVGGFKNIKMAGDYEMWHRLASAYPVLLMPKGIVWYREHDNQEMSSYSNYYQLYSEITLDYLADAFCPLDKNKSLAVVNKLLRMHLKLAVKKIMFFKLKRAVTDLKIVNKIFHVKSRIKSKPSCSVPVQQSITDFSYSS